MKKRLFTSSSSILLVLLTTACFVAAAPKSTEEWITLLNEDLAAWRTYQQKPDAPVKWALEGEVLAWRKDAGNLLTRETFSDFELELEWKISTGGNSGIMFGVDEASAKPWHTGPELQILDDSGHKDGQNPKTSSGALYALYPPLEKASKPAGEWNTQRVRVKCGKIDSWLNGVHVLDIIIGSDHWKVQVAASKLAHFGRFAQVANGHILLQDHGDPVWFRMIRIRRL